MGWRRVAGGVVTLAIAVALFKARVDHPAPRLANTPQPTVQVGDEGTLGSTTPPRLGATTSTYRSERAQTASETTEALASLEPGAVVRGNRTVGDVDGFRLYLTVGKDGGTQFEAVKSFDLTLRVENLAPETRQYDTNERRHFEMTRAATNEVVWDETRCKAPVRDPLVTGTLELAHGRSVSYADAYKGGQCALPAGRYNVVGVFTWCPPGSAPRGTCYPDRVATVRSLPVEVTLTP
jgi:hypothetical protein